MSRTAACPALIVAAPASGQGKTTVTAALARRYRNAGLAVRVFKCGPDFLDPMILDHASGHPVHSLDLFMVGEDHCRRLLHAAAAEADVILIEGVMGLFDGDPSTADIAARFALPVLAVIDGSAMAQTFGALTHGLAGYRDDIQLAGVIANRVAGSRHADMLEASVRAPVRWMGAIERDLAFGLPERHLGLLMASEIADLDRRLDACAAALPASVDTLPAASNFDPPDSTTPLPPLLRQRTIAIARDACFAFIYPDNLAVLREMGARLAFFSPLAGDAIPECDAIWLPGGYPELHTELLASNVSWRQDLRRHHAKGTPILAECGGMMVCADRITTLNDQSHAMAGLLAGDIVMQARLGGLGLQEIDLGRQSLRGHSFHYSRFDTSLPPAIVSRNPNGGRTEPVFVEGSLTASYVHGYFRSAPETIAAVLGALTRR